MSWRLNTRSAPPHPRARARWWMGATIVASGAVVGAYLLDPARGPARRARIVESTRRLTGRTRARISRVVPFMKESEGSQQAAGWPQEPPPDVDSES